MKSTIDQILKEYLKSSLTEQFKNNHVQRIISHVLKTKVIETSHINQHNYLVKGSAGQGQWAKVPWLGIFDRDISTTAEKGFYIVYLFAEDMSGVYLSLNQGWTFYTSTYKRQATLISQKISEYLREKLRSDCSNYPEITIDLKASQRLGKGYETGNIISKFYPKDNIPLDFILADDLRRLMGIFQELKQFIPSKEEDLPSWVDDCILRIESGIEDDDESFQLATQKCTPKQFEDKPETREEKTQTFSKNYYKRRPQKAKNALNYANYTCEYDCSHNTFKSKATGRQYVEAHHLIPISKQQYYRNNLDVEANIVSLCPNCHRKIHLGTNIEKRIMEESLIELRKDRLKKAGLIE